MVNKLLFLCFVHGSLVANQLVAAQYVLPDPTIEVFTPSGIRVSIPDAPGLQFFVFHGKVNEAFRGTGKNTEPGTIDIEVTKATNGRWVAENEDVTFQVGDVLYYWLFAQNENFGYRKADGRFDVKALLNKDGSIGVGPTPGTPTDEEPVVPKCEPTVTIVNGEKSCRGKLIFEEDFSKPTLDTRKWTLEQRIPQVPDYEFISYQRTSTNSFISEGKLNLVPSILSTDENFIESGTLDLSEGCTGRTGSEECIKTARSYLVLPPVVSAKVTTNPYFSFLYGKIEIRAKLPVGDWLFPEMFLVPKDHEYGSGYESGRMWVGLAVGNSDLRTNEGRDINSKELRGGLLLAQSGPLRDVGIRATIAPAQSWSSDFHTYTLVWRPEGITVAVDSVTYGAIQPPPDGFAALAKQQNLRYAERWKGIMSPFDREFYISLGVGGGGISMFPDNAVSGGNAKPWRNKDAKALLFYWQAQNKWLPTWRGNSSGLQIDSVKVWAL